MPEGQEIFVGKGAGPVQLLTRLANRHGLIAGATGTGKTVTLQALAEGFSAAGVPVFMADVKGDLAGISQPGGGNAKLEERAKVVGLPPLEYRACPAVFWDLYRELGHPVRATVSDMGPLLLARLLDLNATQEGVLNIAFKYADDEGLLLLDFKDLRSILAFVGDNAKELKSQYGNVSAASVGAIQRALLVLEQQGAEHFFGEPALELADFMRAAPDGRGVVSILSAEKLIHTPRLYSTFLLWLLSELFEELPEAGDLPKPKLVFFFDEAHLLFDEAPKSLVDKVEQVVRLIRSKGVGVYFVTQNPLDVPDAVLGQLGNRFQHALRAFTPRDQKAVRAAAETFRANSALDTEKVITELVVGEALVSTLDAKGAPHPVERTLIRPPASRLGPITPEERRAAIQSSPVAEKYAKDVDRDSAHERLKARAEQTAAAPAHEPQSAPPPRREAPSAPAPRAPRSSGGRQRQSAGEAFMKSTLRSVGSSLGRSLIRGILGSLTKGR